MPEEVGVTEEFLSYTYSSDTLNGTIEVVSPSHNGGRLVFETPAPCNGNLYINGHINIGSSTTTSLSSIGFQLGTTRRSSDTGIVVFLQNLTPGESRPFSKNIWITKDTYYTLAIGRSNTTVLGGTITGTFTVTDFYINCSAT